MGNKFLHPRETLEFIGETHFLVDPNLWNKGGIRPFYPGNNFSPSTVQEVINTPRSSLICRRRGILLLKKLSRSKLCWNSGVVMKSTSVRPFAKTVTCPSSSILLSFSSNTLSLEITSLVSNHLAACDFCSAEIPILAFYQTPLKGECKAPEIPIDLRILAESILGKSSRTRRIQAQNESS